MGNVPQGRKPSWMRDIIKPDDVQRSTVLMVNGVELYKTAKHRAISERHRREHPYCWQCEQQGIVRLAHMMDHVIPVNAGGDPWHPVNRQSMCNPCHNIKRGKEAHGHIEPYVINAEGYKVPAKPRYIKQ